MKLVEAAPSWDSLFRLRDKGKWGERFCAFFPHYVTFSRENKGEKEIKETLLKRMDVGTVFVLL